MHYPDNRALVARGSLTFWFDEESIAVWRQTERREGSGTRRFDNQRVEAIVGAGPTPIHAPMPESIPYFEKHADMRGELHDLFDEIRGLGADAHERLERIEKEIWGTWAEVEAAVNRHGAGSD